MKLGGEDFDGHRHRPGARAKTDAGTVVVVMSALVGVFGQLVGGGIVVVGTSIAAIGPVGVVMGESVVVMHTVMVRSAPMPGLAPIPLERTIDLPEPRTPMMPRQVMVGAVVEPKGVDGPPGEEGHEGQKRDESEPTRQGKPRPPAGMHAKGPGGGATGHRYGPVCGSAGSISGSSSPVFLRMSLWARRRRALMRMKPRASSWS